MTKRKEKVVAEDNPEIQEEDEDGVPIVKLSTEEGAELIDALTKKPFFVASTATGKIVGDGEEEFKKLSPKRQRMLIRAFQGLPPNEVLGPDE